MVKRQRLRTVDRNRFGQRRHDCAIAVEGAKLVPVRLSLGIKQDRIVGSGGLAHGRAGIEHDRARRRRQLPPQRIQARHRRGDVAAEEIFPVDALLVRDDNNDNRYPALREAIADRTNVGVDASKLGCENRNWLRESAIVAGIDSASSVQNIQPSRPKKMWRSSGRRSRPT